VEHVYGVMDRVHRARRTGLRAIIKLGPLATGLSAWIESTKGYLRVLIGAIDREMSDGGPVPQMEVAALGLHGERQHDLFGTNNAAVTTNLTWGSTGMRRQQLGLTTMT
jgi:hypothetical protein